VKKLTQRGRARNAETLASRDGDDEATSCSAHTTDARGTIGVFFRILPEAQQVELLGAQVKNIN